MLIWWSAIFSVLKCTYSKILLGWIKFDFQSVFKQINIIKCAGGKHVVETHPIHCTVYINDTAIV